MVQQGTFIVIEGTDGSGKGTQFSLLAERLKNDGYDVALFDFPQYDNGSSYFVKQYLNGNYGSAEDVGPYTGSLFYALDRYEAGPKIRQALAEGKVVLANRYVGSNMAHQGTKFSNAAQRRGYFIWLDNLEFEMLGIPRPTLSIVLRVPAEIAQQMVDKKESRGYTTKKRDIHEADLGHMQRSVEVYDDLCQLFPRDFSQIDCVRSNKLLDIEAIHDLIWGKIEALLPASTNGQGSISSSVVENALVVRDENGLFKITAEGHDFLEQAVTSTSGNVYAFTQKLDPVTVAAAMARLSRRGDDMRITILDEFVGNIGKDQQLLQRVITAYGDDSVQQLTGIHMVVEKASNLLTKKLEWGRLASYLEQSTRYIYYDEKDSNGKYRYHVPEHFDKATKQQYVNYLDRIFDLYSRMVHSLTDYLKVNSSVPKSEQDAAWRSAVKAQACDAIRPTLPVATQSTVGIFASGQAIESLIMHLLSDPLAEAQKVGQELLNEARKIAPAFLERADKPERGGATIAYRAKTRAAVAKIAQQELPEVYGGQSPAVQLTDIWPKNELDLVPDMLYEFSNLSLKEIRGQVANWSYAKKLEVVDAYIGERLNRRHKPGRALEKAHYSWDLMCDYGIFRDLQRHRIVDDLEWQYLSPRFGYEIPKLVEDAGLTDLFETCFDLSLQLYSLLQKAGYDLDAQYATLLGHRMRWKVTYNAREAFHLHELRTSPQGHPGYRKLVREMHDLLTEKHPIMGEAMRFVSQDEDPELTRLAAERYTQFKLDQLQ